MWYRLQTRRPTPSTLRTIARTNNRPLMSSSLIYTAKSHQSPFGCRCTTREMTTASVDAAIDDPHDVAPLFRTPGFGRSPTVKQTLATRCSAAAAEWFRRIKPAEIIESAMARCNQRGKGILTLHNTHSLVPPFTGLLSEPKHSRTRARYAPSVSSRCQRRIARVSFVSPER